MSHHGGTGHGPTATSWTLLAQSNLVLAASVVELAKRLGPPPKGTGPLAKLMEWVGMVGAAAKLWGPLSAAGVALWRWVWPWARGWFGL